MRASVAWVHPRAPAGRGRRSPFPGDAFSEDFAVDAQDVLTQVVEDLLPDVEATGAGVGSPAIPARGRGANGIRHRRNRIVLGR